MAGRPESARLRTERLVERFQSLPGLTMRVLPLLASAYLELGSSGRAAALAEDAISRATSGQQQLVLVEALRVKGMIATRQTAWAEGEAALREALTLSQEMRYPYAEAKIHYTVGLLRCERKQLDRARAELQAARNICKRLGERLYRTHIARRLTIIEQSRISH
jgi:hypothetical protein